MNTARNFSAREKKSRSLYMSDESSHSMADSGSRSNMLASELSPDDMMSEMTSISFSSDTES